MEVFARLKAGMSRRRRRLGVLAGGLAFMGVVSALMMAWALSTRALYLDESMETARGLTRTYQAYTETLMHGIDLTLSLTARQARQQGGLGPRLYQGVDDMLAGSMAHMRYVSGIVIVNARGQIVHATEDARSTRGRDVRHRDFHAAHVGAKAVDFHVGRMVESVLHPGQWRFSVSRVLKGPRDEFLGTVAALVDVREMGREYAAQLKNPDASVTLMYLDGTVMSRAPYMPDQIGKVLPSFARYKGNPPMENSFIIRSQVDQVRRLIAQRRFDGMPLLIAVTMLERAAMDRWRATLPALWMLWGLLLLATVAVGGLLARQRARQQGALAALRESEERFATVFRRNPTAMAIRDRDDDTIVDVNPGFERLMGMPREELVGRKVSVFGSMFESTRREQALAELERHGRVANTELRLRRADASVTDVLLSLESIQIDGRARILGVFVDISDRVRAEKQVREALREKEVLLKEVYHRVKNNMQVVASLLSMQAFQSTGEARDLLEESAARVKSMALVHEQLYRSPSLSNIDLPDYVRRLTAHLADMHAGVAERVSVHVEVEHVQLGIDTAIPLGLILNELISNCYKYAFPRERTGQVRVRLARATGGELELEVADDGVGLPRDFDPVRQTTLGMKLLKSLAMQLDGQIAHGAGRGGQGVRVTLRFPGGTPSGPGNLERNEGLA